MSQRRYGEFRGRVKIEDTKNRVAQNTVKIKKQFMSSVGDNDLSHGNNQPVNINDVTIIHISLDHGPYRELGTMRHCHHICVQHRSHFRWRNVLKPMTVYLVLTEQFTFLFEPIPRRDVPVVNPALFMQTSTPEPRLARIQSNIATTSESLLKSHL